MKLVVSVASRHDIGCRHHRSSRDVVHHLHGVKPTRLGHYFDAVDTKRGIQLIVWFGGLLERRIMEILIRESIGVRIM